jgi:hypothetical protein
VGSPLCAGEPLACIPACLLAYLQHLQPTASGCHHVHLHNEQPTASCTHAYLRHVQPSSCQHTQSSTARVSSMFCEMV